MEKKFEKEFVPVDLALRLKALRFDEPCMASRDMGNNHGLIQVPTWQSAFRWFREKYNLVHTVYSNASGYIWELHYNKERGGTHICDSGESGDCEMSGMFTTYEKAEISCLTKLIEIVENEKML